MEFSSLIGTSLPSKIEVSDYSYKALCEMPIDKIDNWKAELEKELKTAKSELSQIHNDILEKQRKIIEIQLDKKVKEAEQCVKKDTVDKLSSDIRVLTNAFFASKSK